MKKLLFGILLMGAAFSASAQNGQWGATPQDSIACITGISLYKEYFNQKNYQDAKAGWKSAFDICPKSRKSLYIDGAKMYKKFIKEEKDPAVKAGLMDTLMLIYDRRIESFGEKGKVLDKKGSDCMRYKKKAGAAEAFAILDEAKTLQGNKLSPTGCVYWYKSQFEMLRKKELTKDSVIMAFGPIMDIIEFNIQNGKSDKIKGAYGKAKNNVEKMFFAIAKCENLVEVYSKKMAETPNDTTLLKSIVKYMGRQKCESEKLYRDAATALHTLKPTDVSALAIGKLNLKGESKNFAEALKFFKEAASLATTDELKVEANINAAKCSYNQKSFGSVIAYCNKALAVNPKLGEAWMLIGDAYMNGGKKCGGTGNCVSKANYWVAYDKYAKAKSVDPTVADKAGKRMGSAKAQYPKKNDCFFEGKNPGDTFEFSCFGGTVTTTVRIRE